MSFPNGTPGAYVSIGGGTHTAVTGSSQESIGGKSMARHWGFIVAANVLVLSVLAWMGCTLVKCITALPMRQLP